ncbi:hypothetical protein Tco_0672900 [Tanacetum coccineum]
MAFLTAVASSRFPSTNNQLRTSSNLRNQATIQDGRVTVQQVQGRQGQSYSGTGYKSNVTSSGGNNASGQARIVKCYNCQAEAQEAGQILDEEQLAFLADPGVLDGQAVQTIIPNTAAFQTEDLNTYDSDCDDLSNVQAVLMANISNYGSDVISEVPHFETNPNDMENQSVHAMQDFEQPPAMDFTDNEIHSDSNIISYSYYLQETQQANVQDTYLQAQQDSMILSVIEQICREKMIDSQMDDMIKEKLALKEQVDSLEQNLSKQIKEKECLLQTFTVFKMGQSAQTVHMLTKPQAFYDNIHKQALGYQNPFYLRKAQRIKPTLYDGIVMSDKHVAMPVIDDEETLILEEKSRSKMSEKAKDPEIINKNISHKSIDYENLNRLSEDFGKRFTPQQEMDAEQAFWLHISNPTSKPSDASIIKIEAPNELPKVSLVNESLKKLKFHLARFDNVVKIRTTPDARTEDILLTVINSMSSLGESMNMERKRNESCDKCFNLDAELLKSQNANNDLLKRYYKINERKSKEENVNYDFGEIETKNIELENSVAKLLSENERLCSMAKLSSENERLCNEINHVKQVFKEQFDSIKKTHVRTKEQSDSLIDKLNLKSAKNKDLKAQIQDKVFVITSLKNNLQKLKGKEIVDIVAQTPSAHIIVSGMFKLDLEPLAPTLL